MRRLTRTTLDYLQWALFPIAALVTLEAIHRSPLGQGVGAVALPAALVAVAFWAVALLAHYKVKSLSQKIEAPVAAPPIQASDFDERARSIATQAATEAASQVTSKVGNAVASAVTNAVNAVEKVSNETTLKQGEMAKALQTALEANVREISRIASSVSELHEKVTSLEGKFTSEDLQGSPRQVVVGTAARGTSVRDDARFKVALSKTSASEEQLPGNWIDDGLPNTGHIIMGEPETFYGALLNLSFKLAAAQKRAGAKDLTLLIRQIDDALHTVVQMGVDATNKKKDEPAGRLG